MARYTLSFDMAIPDLLKKRETWVILGTAGTLVLGGLALYFARKDRQEDLDGQANATERPEEPLVAPGDKVLLIGDSIGVGLEHPLRLALGEHGVSLDAVVKSGASIRSTKDKAPLGGQYKLALISLGSNDAAQADPSAEMDDAAELFGRLVGAEERAWIYPPGFAAGTSPQAGKEAVEEIFRSYSISALPIEAASVLQDPMRLHPSPDGYRRMALDIARLLVE